MPGIPPLLVLLLRMSLEPGPICLAHRQSAAFSQALGDPSPYCLSGGVAPKGSLGDTTENLPGGGDGHSLASISTPQTGNSGCVRTRRFDIRDEPFPTISSTVPFSVENGSNPGQFGDDLGHTCIHVIADGVQVSQLSVPAGILVGGKG